MTLILASTSPYRRELLARLRLPFKCVAPGIEEAHLVDECPRQRATRLARAKAEAVALLHPEAAIIGSDQVASLAGRILDKPGNMANAMDQLRQCSGQCVEFETGVCVLGPQHPPQATTVATRVYFRDLDKARIRRYLELDQPFDCAGSFKWEALGIALFESLDSEDPTALEGLPLIALTGMLTGIGLDPLAM